MRFTDAQKGRITALVDEGWSERRIAKRLNCNQTSVRKYVKEYRGQENFLLEFSNAEGKERPRLAQIASFFALYKEHLKNAEYLVNKLLAIWSIQAYAYHR